MIKKNVAIVCLDNNDAKKISKKIAEKLNMIFADIDDIISQKISEQDSTETNLEGLKDAQKALFEEMENFDNTVICCNVEFLTKDNNLETIKKCSKIIYLKCQKTEIIQDNLSFNLGYAFDIENEFCEKNADFVVEIAKNSVIDEILQIIRECLLKGELV